MCCRSFVSRLENYGLVVHVICGAENSENLEKSLKCPFRWLTLG